MSLFGYVIRRLVQMTPVLIGITLVAFLAIQLIPGDPIVIMLGGRASPETIAAAHEKFGLDEPVVTRYVIFLGNLLQGDLGMSITQRTPVMGILESAGPLFLLLWCDHLGGAGMPLAVLAARRRTG
jgi:peptide/nickel transport system permease protein